MVDSGAGDSGGGSGVFGASTTYATGTNPASVYATDLNGDGHADLLSADYGSNQITVRFNDGNGAFGARTTYATGSNPRSVYAIDLDGDGDNDLLSADYGSDQISVRFNQ